VSLSDQIVVYLEPDGRSGITSPSYTTNNNYTPIREPEYIHSRYIGYTYASADVLRMEVSLLEVADAAPTKGVSSLPGSGISGNWLLICATNQGFRSQTPL
jgi:hypothetical protein